MSIKELAAQCLKEKWSNRDSEEYFGTECAFCKDAVKKNNGSYLGICQKTCLIAENPICKSLPILADKLAYLNKSPIIRNMPQQDFDKVVNYLKSL